MRLNSNEGYDDMGLIDYGERVISTSGIEDYTVERVVIGWEGVWKGLY